MSALPSRHGRSMWRPNWMRSSPVSEHVGGDLLVGNLFVLAHDLHVERGKEILVLVTHDEQGLPQRAVGIGFDVDESVRTRRPRPAARCLPRRPA